MNLKVNDLGSNSRTMISRWSKLVTLPREMSANSYLNSTNCHCVKQVLISIQQNLCSHSNVAWLPSYSRIKNLLSFSVTFSSFTVFILFPLFSLTSSSFLPYLFFVSFSLLSLSFVLFLFSLLFLLLSSFTLFPFSLLFLLFSSFTLFNFYLLFLLFSSLPLFQLPSHLGR